MQIEAQNHLFPLLTDRINHNNCIIGQLDGYLDRNEANNWNKQY